MYVTWSSAGASRPSDRHMTHPVCTGWSVWITPLMPVRVSESHFGAFDDIFPLLSDVSWGLWYPVEREDASQARPASTVGGSLEVVCVLKGSRNSVSCFI